MGRALAVTCLENDDSAFIEVAAASGLVLLQPDERDPLQTSTYGTGQAKGFLFARRQRYQ